MGAPFKITLLSDVSSFLKGTSDVEKGLEDVASSLDELAADTKQNADKAADALTREFSTAFDKVKTESKTAGRKIGDDLHDGARKAKDGIEELGDEANQTAREAAASFDGSAESIMDAFQEVAANAFAGFGPAGALAGLAAAAGIGLVFNSLQDAADKAADAKDQVLDFADAINEVGGNPKAVRWAEKLRDTMKEITNTKEWFEFWQAAPETRLEEWTKYAKDFGVSMRDTGAYVAGSADAQARVTDQLRMQREELVRQRDASGSYEEIAAINEKVTALDTYRAQLDGQAKTITDAADLNRGLAEALSAVDESAADAAEASAQFSDSLTDHLSVADEGLDEFVKKGKLNLAEWTAELKARAAETKLVTDFSIDVAPKLSDAAMNNFAKLPTETQTLIAQAFKDGSKSDKKAIIANLEAEAKVKNVKIDTSGVQAEADKNKIEIPTTVISDGAVKGAQTAANNAQGVANKPSNIIEYQTKLNSSGLQGDVNRAAAGITAPTIWATVKVRKEVP